MKKLLFYSFSILILFSCSKDDSVDPDYSGVVGCRYNGKALHVGPKGGCYYMNSNGNKTYVDRYHCNCK